MPASSTSVEAALCCSLSLRAEDATSLTLAPGWQKVCCHVPDHWLPGGAAGWRLRCRFTAPGRGFSWPRWRGGIRLDWWTLDPGLVRATTCRMGKSRGEPDRAPPGRKSCRPRMSYLISSGRSGGGGGGDVQAPAPCAPLTRVPPA